LSFIQYISILIFITALGVAIWTLLRYRKAQRRRRLYATPLKPEWVKLLQQHVPLASKLPKELQHLYHGHINYFLATKVFVGRGGFEVNDEARVIIAGNACLLVLTRSEPIFPGFKTIIVYPQTYAASIVENNGGVIVSRMQSRAGESWYRGPVVLAWNDVWHGTIKSDDAHNVVIHEFAHKLDEENRLMDGLPILKDHSHYNEWAEVLTREFEEFIERVQKNRNRVIDSYGAVSAVEFFSVISESFFEKPQQMKDKLPALYEQLSRYYGVDTAEW